MHVMPRMTNRRDRPASDSGQVLVIFTLFLIVLIGATALAVDYGSWLKVRRDYQNAADAAALAGAAHLSRPLDATKHTEARQAAWESLNAQLGLGVDAATLASSAASSTNNGAGVSAGNYRAWVASPASDAGAKYPGNYSSTNGTVFVWVEAANQSFFSGVFGIGQKTVPAWATAGAGTNRFAVITLRKPGQPPVNAPEDIKVAGGTTVTVHNGDVGGNWTLNFAGLPASTYMKFQSATTDTYGPYVNQNVSGTSPGDTWVPYNIVDGSSPGNPIPVNFIQEVPDPAYPAPCLDSTCLVDRGSFSQSNSSTDRDQVSDTCPAAAGSPDRLPAGHYANITVKGGKCVVLDPTIGTVAGKENGIYYITGQLDINNGGLVVGNGVTLVFGHAAQLTPQGTGGSGLPTALSLNASTTACGGQTCKYGAWTTAGDYSWSTVTSDGAVPTYTVPTNPFDKGIAAYVCRSSSSCGTGGSASSTTEVIKMNAGSGLDYTGVIYAPFDNVTIAGQPNHKDTGQIVSWTLFLVGQTAMDQWWDGPESALPTLIEPTTTQATYP